MDNPDIKRMNDERLKAITRRHFFKQSGYGIGSLALGSLMNETLFAAAAGANDLPQSPLRKGGSLEESPLAKGGNRGVLDPRSPHFAPKAKNIIFLFMAGAPTQLDLFDYKPKLVQLNGQKI